MKCKTCYFYQEDKCILNKSTSLSFFCSTFIRKIHGIDATEKYLDIFKDHPYVFNLGHGITPEVDPEHARVFIESVHELSDKYHR